MLQAANNDLFNPLVPNARNSEIQILLVLCKLTHWESVKLIGGFLFFSPPALMG